jgi:hypothetical protein
MFDLTEEEYAGVPRERQMSTLSPIFAMVNFRSLNQ